MRKSAPQKIVADGLSQVPEGRHVFSGLTVQENLDMGAFLRKDSTLKEDFEQIFAKFPILKERRNQDACDFIRWRTTDACNGTSFDV
ncbi:hypothetical protein V4S33_09325 [Enterococcus cecorum]